MPRLGPSARCGSLKSSLSARRARITVTVRGSNGDVLAQVSSKCTTKNKVPLTWVDYFQLDHESVIALEKWLADLPEVVRESFEGQIDALRDLAAKGEIGPLDETRLKPVIRHPELFELRWRFKRGKKKTNVRQYHGEPSSLPDKLVSTHRHIKRVDGTEDEVQTWQNQEMAHAKLRYRAGESSDWR
jgi:hypothetical protein